MSKKYLVFPDQQVVLNNYGTDVEYIPEHTQEMLENYMVHGFHPGGFGAAVLSNDLCAAVYSADHVNRQRLDVIVRWCSTSLPSVAWGSADAMKAWMADEGGRRSTWVQEREKAMIMEVLSS